jgi:hypothetical protein
MPTYGGNPQINTRFDRATYELIRLRTEVEGFSSPSEWLRKVAIAALDSDTAVVTQGEFRTIISELREEIEALKKQSAIAG